MRYDAQTFPENLVFQETADSSNVQGRYVMQHAFKGELICDAADSYYQGVRTREEQEAKNLAELTGWELSDIRTKMKLDEPFPKKKGNGKADKNWYQDLWK